MSYWKQFLFYVIRTFLLDRSTCDQLYGIQFTEHQQTIIGQLLDLLNSHRVDKDESTSDGVDDDSDEMDDEEYDSDSDLESDDDEGHGKCV